MMISGLNRSARNWLFLVVMLIAVTGGAFWAYTKPSSKDMSMNFHCVHEKKFT